MKKKSKPILALLLALAMMLALAACGGQPAGDQPGNSGSSAPVDPSDTPSAQAGQELTGGNNSGPVTEKPAGIQPGTTFKYCITMDFPSHLPWIDNNAGPLVYQIYSTLVYKYHADPNDIRGDLAEKWTSSDDGLTWVFKLREDAKFTSGNPVTANSVVKSWDAAKDFVPRWFSVVESYEATGEYEVTVKLNAPSPTFIYDLPMNPNCAIVDEKALEQYGAEDNRSAIGSGPYYIEKYTSGEGFVLKANPDYYNPDKAPSIETCEMVVIPEENTAMLAMMGGQLDLLITSNMEIVKSLETSGACQVIAVPGQNHPWWYNPKEVEIFKDPVVREALCHIIDWDAINTLVYDGRLLPLNSYFPDAGSYPLDKASYACDPEKGIKMLEDAGYKKDDIAFSILCNPSFKDLCVAVEGQFKEHGFNNITAEVADMTTCLGEIRGGTYDMTTTHNGYAAESPLSPYTMGLLPDGAQRIIWMDQMTGAEAAYQEALDHYNKAASAPDFETYEKEVSEITRLAQENFCAIGGLRKVEFFALGNQFAGLYKAPISGYMEFCYLYSTEG